LFTAPFGWHLFHPTLSTSGQLALTVWRPGGFLDIALLENQGLRLLTSDRAQDQFPAWLPSGLLEFTSDRSGSFQAYQIEPGSSQIAQLSAATGGVYASSILPDGNLAFSGYTSTGFEVRRLQIGLTKPHFLTRTEPKPLEQLSGLEYAVEPYVPVPIPLFWTPLSARGLGATLYGADPAGINNYTLSAGYALFGNPGLEAQASFSFQPLRDWSLTANAFADSSGWTLSLTPAWFGLAQTQGLGVYSYRVALSARAKDTGFDLSAGFALEALIEDEYGYTQSGWSTAASLSSTGKFGISLSLADPGFGLPIVVTSRLNQDQFSARISSQFSFKLDWFNADGLIGIARVSLVPFLEYQFVTSSNYIFGTQVLLDGVFNYYAPVSIGLEFSYSSGNGFRLNLVTLIPLLTGLR
jgi:hypothetical protein